MSTNMFRKELSPCTTIVVKVGSKIAAPWQGSDATLRISQIAHDCHTLMQAGCRTVIVSSGAIAHGMATLNLAKKPGTIPLKQACAAIGQNRLMDAWHGAFKKYTTPVGQVLLTWDDLRDKKRYLNLRNTLFALFESGAVPIINENDSLGVEEIRFGDNDTLGAQIALLVNADAYVMLTDVAGLFTANPHTEPLAQHIEVVSKINDALMASATGKGSEISTGGMSTKLTAASMVTKAGIPALIGNGFSGRLCDIMSKTDQATLFTASAKRMTSRDRWIAFSGKAKGSVIIDSGAVMAIVKRGKSLLPAGIKSVIGNFSEGDMVDIQDENCQTFARGLANFSSADINCIKGKNSTRIIEDLGHKNFDEVIHRNNLVLI